MSARSASGALSRRRRRIGGTDEHGHDQVKDPEVDIPRPGENEEGQPPEFQTTVAHPIQRGMSSDIARAQPMAARLTKASVTYTTIVGYTGLDVSSSVSARR